MHLSIGDHYFAFQPPVEHEQDCSLHGTGMWEVTRLKRDHSVLAPDGSRDETITRLVCRQCGVVHIETAHGSTSFEFTSVDRIGYGAKPKRSCGLWLHPGPYFELSFTDDRGPEMYYVTGGDEPPFSPDVVIGVVGWKLGQRGGLRWYAGYGLSEGKYGFHVTRNADPDDFKSQRAAVQWVVDQHAAAHASLDRQKLADGRPNP